MTKAVVIFSGGPDSTAAALWALENGFEPELLTYQVRNNGQYGEIKASILVADKLGLPHQIINLTSPMHIYERDFHIMRHAGIRENERTANGVGVPFGSGMILSFTASYCIDRGVQDLIWGATLDDGLVSKRYTKDFADDFVGFVNKYVGSSLRAHTPFARSHKYTVLEAFKAKEALFGLTCSCSCEGEDHCGECGACIARIAAAKVAGLSDETKYLKVQLPEQVQAMVSDPGAYSDDDWAEILDCSDRGSPI